RSVRQPCIAPLEIVTMSEKTLRTTEAENAELESIALDLFSAAVAHHNGVSQLTEKVARDSFRRAEVYLDVRERVRTGELSIAIVAKGPQLADCSCPN